MAAAVPWEEVKRNGAIQMAPAKESRLGNTTYIEIGLVLTFIGFTFCAGMGWKTLSNTEGQLAELSRNAVTKEDVESIVRSAVAGELGGVWKELGALNEWRRTVEGQDR